MFLIKVSQRTPHHQADQFVMVCLLRHHGVHIFAVTHNRYPVRNNIQFRHSVADINDANAIFLQFTDCLK